LRGRDAGRLAGDQIVRPEPHAQRRVRALHDRSCRQSDAATALAAPQDPGPIGKTKRVSGARQWGQTNPLRHRAFSRLGGACCFVGG
jgi:hypothetical protein